MAMTRKNLWSETLGLCECWRMRVPRCKKSGCQEFLLILIFKSKFRKLQLRKHRVLTCIWWAHICIRKKTKWISLAIMSRKTQALICKMTLLSANFQILLTRIPFLLCLMAATWTLSKAGQNYLINQPTIIGMRLSSIYFKPNTLLATMQKSNNLKI